MSGQGGRLARAVRGTAALVILVALVIGLPLVLYQAGGDPLPGHLPGWHQVSHALLHQDNGTIFLAAVRDISWIGWALFTVAVLAEAQAVLRGRKAPRLRLGGLQNAAGWLVAFTAVALSSQPAATLMVPAAAASVVASPAPAAPAAAAPSGAHTSPQPEQAVLTDFAQAAAPAGQEAAAAPDPQVMNMAFYQLVTVRPGDCLWTIAQHYLGAGDRYQEIVRLNLGHDMGHGAAFTDPSVIWPGWVLQLPGGAGAHAAAQSASPAAGHPAHRAGDRHFGSPHHGAGTGQQAGHGAGQSAGPATAGAAAPGAASPGAASPATAGGANAGGANAGNSQAGGATPLPETARTAVASARVPEPAAIPQLAVFAAGMLAGGAGVMLAGMRHRQRQARRAGRRIPLPASAPVVVAEQRLRTAATMVVQPATALRAALSDLGVSLLESGRQLPELTGIRLLPTGMEVLLASPAIEPPPPPFTVPGGRQGRAWRLALPEQAPSFPFEPAEAGDLMPGLFTIGVDEDDGYLLLDPEYLRVTTAEGPADLVDRVLTTAAAELATSQLAGWYDLILVGFPELDAVGGRTTSCASLEEALDLLASKAVVLRRRLGESGLADIRHRRLTQPGDEDWALTLLISRDEPTAGQLALVADLASDPGGIAALVAGGTDVPGGHPPVSVLELSADHSQPGGMVAHISPPGLDAWPQPLTEADYRALGSMFTIAGDLRDVPADAPPYDGSSWPPEPASDLLAELPGWLDTADQDLAEDPYQAGASGLTEDPALAGERAQTGDPGLAGGPGLADSGPADAGLTSTGLTGTGQTGTGLAEADDLPDRPEPGVPGPGVPGPGSQGRPPHSAPTLRLVTGGREPEQPPGQDRDGQHRDGLGRDAVLRVGVLGTFTINGSPAALLPAQSQLVLALAMNGPGGLSNQQLCYLLGADPDHPKPTDSLRQLIVRTRRQLGRAPGGREWIEHLGSGQYALHPDAKFDWAEFEERSGRGLRGQDPQQLRDALSLIRGQPFTGCYHWWLDLAFTESVRAQIVDTAEALAGLELSADPAASARAARTGLAGDATAEQLWRALMRAEYAAGNLSGVRDAWSRCMDAIADIAPDGEPHPETAALYHKLVSGKQSQPAWTPR